MTERDMHTYRYSRIESRQPCKSSSRLYPRAPPHPLHDHRVKLTACSTALWLTTSYMPAKTTSSIQYNIYKHMHTPGTAYASLPAIRHGNTKASRRRRQLTGNRVSFCLCALSVHTLVQLDLCPAQSERHAHVHMPSHSLTQQGDRICSHAQPWYTIRANQSASHQQPSC